MPEQDYKTPETPQASHPGTGESVPVLCHAMKAVKP